MYRIAGDSTLDDVLETLAQGREVYALREAEEGQYRFVHAAAWQRGEHTLGPFRPVEPVKSLFFRPREYIGAVREPVPGPAMPERIVLGVKNCDLSALAIHDAVFLGEPCQDPGYAEAREKTVLVSCDCTDCLDVCFCPAVREQPHPKDGFDINISPIEGTCLIEAGSERGEKLLAAAAGHLEPASEADLEARDNLRAAMYEKVAHQAAEFGLCADTDLQGAVKGSYHSGLWEEFARDCVECGACNFVCCTCHCFLLADGYGGDGTAARTRLWDSCLLKNFARTAGGGNPRAWRAQRLRNRFDKKFGFFPQVLGRYACDGCGRCTEACIGKIDIRAVLKRAVDESQSILAHSGHD